MRSLRIRNQFQGIEPMYRRLCLDQPMSLTLCMGLAVVGKLKPLRVSMSTRTRLMLARLLAIMLGRLAMTVDECIQEYERYVKIIFQHPRKITMSGFLRSKYPLYPLTQATRRIISDFDKSTEDVGWRRSIFASPSSKCKM